MMLAAQLDVTVPVVPMWPERDAVAGRQLQNKNLKNLIFLHLSYPVFCEFINKKNVHELNYPSYLENLSQR